MSGSAAAEESDTGAASVEPRGSFREAKRRAGVLPEDLRLFDRLTGRQLLTCTGRLRGLDADLVATAPSSCSTSSTSPAPPARSCSPAT